MSVFNHHLVEVARARLGMSQSELAKQIGRSQPFVSKLEGGVLGAPDEATREQLAKALGVPVAYFDTQQPVYPRTHQFHRARKTSHAELDRLWAEMNMFRFSLLPLMRSVERRVDFDLPQYDVDKDNVSPSTAAQFTRVALRVGPGPIRNLVALAERAGVFVISYDFRSAAVDGVSHLGGDGLPHVVFLNTRSPGDRMRFSLAHELAHCVLHRCPSANMEDEANEFAAEFLMPAADIGPILRHKLNLGVVGALKGVWGCSMQAIYRRAKDVDALTDSQYRRAMQSMAPHRTNEPFPVPQENAAGFAELWDFHRRDLQYSSSDLRKLVKMPTDVIQLGIGQKPGLAVVGDG